MRPHLKKIGTALFGLGLLAAPHAQADSEAPNQPRVFTDNWGGCYAKSVPDDYSALDGTTRVYSVGKDEDTQLAAFDWYAQRIEMLCNACDGGTCGPVIVRHGPWSRGHEPKDEDLALAFYLGDKLQKRYSTLDIAGSKDNASISVSHYTVIREHKGFVYTQTGAPRYVVVTEDGRELTFNAVTGEQIRLAANTPAEAALFKAVRAKDKAAITAALKSGADINATVADEYDQNYSETALHAAYQTRDQGLISFLLDKGADINARTHRGETVLSRAVRSTDLLNLEFLLKHGADANTKGPYSGDRMLHKIANAHNGVDMAKILKAHGADIEAANDYGRTPLHTAAHSYQGTGMLAWLLANDANIEAVSDFGETPLHLAARYGQEAHVRMLLEHGAHPSKRDNDKKAPLDYAKTRTDQPGIIKLLENTALK